MLSTRWLLHMMDTEKFKEAVSSLAAFAEDLWIQSEFYKVFIVETIPITPEKLERLAEAACHDSTIRDSAHKLFATFFEVLDKPETRRLMEELLKKPIPPQKAN